MIKLQKCLKSLFLLLLLTGLQACDNEREWDADTSKIEADINITRYDKALFSIDSSHFEQGVSRVFNQYPRVSELLIERILGFGRLEDPRTLHILRNRYLFDPYMRDSLYPVVQKVFTQEEINAIENELEEAFRRVKYFLPVDSAPKVYTVLTAFGYKVVTYESIMAISLDMFLGEDFKFYPALEFPDYQIRRLHKAYIVPEVLRTYYMSLYEEGKYTDETMLSQMIYAGKQLYFVDVMKPEMADTLKIGYSKEQLEWARENEAQMWHHYVTNDLLYTTDQYKLAKYLADAPYTIDDGVPPESAPRLGEYVGWRIVEEYMEENPEVSLEELFKETDYRKILKESKYRPRL